VRKQISDVYLSNTLAIGIGYLFEGSDEKERALVEGLFRRGKLLILIATFSLSWELELTAGTVVILDNQHYYGYEKRYVNHSIPDMLSMMGKCYSNVPSDNTRCLLFCQSHKAEYYKKFMLEPFPVESHLQYNLKNYLSAAVESKAITSKQDCIDWLTWTFFYLRLTKNPNYYNLHSV